MSEYVLKLFIAGNTTSSETAAQSIRKLFNSMKIKNYRIEVIDVLESPDIAESEKVLATPTLIKQMPPPVRRLIGDLSDIEKVKFYLNIE